MAKRCYGYAPTYNKGEYRGRIAEVEEDGSDGSLLINMRADDPWVKGGPLRVRLLYSQTESGTQWTYVGKFKDRSIHGLALCVDTHMQGL